MYAVLSAMIIKTHITDDQMNDNLMTLFSTVVGLIYFITLHT